MELILGLRRGISFLAVVLLALISQLADALEAGVKALRGVPKGEDEERADFWCPRVLFT